MGKAKWSRYISILLILAVFLMITAALLGRMLRPDAYEGEHLALLEPEAVLTATEETGEAARQLQAGGRAASTLLIWDSGNESSAQLRGQMAQIFRDMKTDYTEYDVAADAVPALEAYEKAILALEEYDPHPELIVSLLDWTEAGGSLLIAQVPVRDGASAWLLAACGVRSIEDRYYVMEGLRLQSDFLLGGGRDYQVAGAFESSLEVTLTDDCTVHITTADDREAPLLWERSMEQGRAVVVNMGIYEKMYRGFYAAAYSRLGEFCAYPVINGAAFYLDDFPAPFSTDATPYLQQAYRTNIADFYTTVWWSDITRLIDEYGLRMTGLVLESYSEEMSAPFTRNFNLQQYRHLGNMLRQQGGELALHGYNQMPLCLEPFDFGAQDELYRTWRSEADMRASLEELLRFCKDLSGEMAYQVYAPPSNILSEEGRAMLARDFPEIRAIAGAYLPGELLYEQEFAVARDGIVEIPMVTAGHVPDPSMELAALSELNFHYVSSHLISPADILTPEGAAMGWPAMLEGFRAHLAWLYGAAPGLRSLSASELAAAVQRFSAVGVQARVTADGLELRLSGLRDEAWLLVRLNEWAPDEDAVTGGTLTRLQGDLYLLRAEEAQVTIGKRVEA